LRRYLDVGNHALKVKSVGVLVKVLVVVDLEAGILEDWDVVAPGRGGDKDLLGGREPTGKEFTSDAKSTSTGDRLGNSNLSTRRIKEKKSLIHDSRHACFVGIIYFHEAPNNKEQGLTRPSFKGALSAP
jgi:hypothetical protein